MKSLFLSYTDADGVPPFFQLLEDQSSYNLVFSSAQLLGRVVTKLQSEGAPDQPILEIVVIADERPSQEEARFISHSAVNWLMDNGHMEFRE